jgi:hypothetical protein
MFRRIVGYFKRRKLNNEIEQVREHYAEIINDPQNGCSGDFAEERDRKILSLKRKIIKSF